MKLRNRARVRSAEVALTRHEQRLVWRIAALLLDYPTAETCLLVDQMSTATTQLTDPRRSHVTDFLLYFCRTEPTERALRYVETFDVRHRSSLHLTYNAYGGTRKRDLALLRLKQAYRQAGFAIGDTEAPDYLPMVLEFAATVDHVSGQRLLTEHLPAVEFLRVSLHASDSPYAGLLAAVLATLPASTPIDRRRIAEFTGADRIDQGVA